MSVQNTILNNFINEIAYIRNNYRNIYDIDNTIITEQLPETFINYANNTFRRIDIENFTREQIQRQQTIINQAIDLFETLLDEDEIFTDEQKNRFRRILDLYNEKKLELQERINPNPRTGGKKFRKGKKSKKGKKYRKNRKSKKRV